MEKRLLRIFQNEVRKQFEFALTSAYSIERVSNNLSEDNANNDLWFFVQSFLISFANVFKLLWGSKGTPLERRQVLRDSLDINGETPINVTRFRNHFERFNERIEKWSNRTERRNYIDSNISPAKMFGDSFET